MRHSILIAIGGGGATHGADPELDRFCLAHTVPNPRMGFLGAGSDDDAGKFRRFRSAFGSHALSITALPVDAGSDTATVWAGEVDLIYVGGGNPLNLVTRWRESGVAEALSAAWRRGVVFAGVSAGAMCWFEHFLWRSGDGDLEVAEGLGLVPGTMTPHSLTEPERRSRMLELVSKGGLPEGYAIDDGAALVLTDGAPSAVWPTVGPPFVHRIGHQNGELVGETVLNA